MQGMKNSTVFAVDGYEVSATFANSRNTAAIGQVKQILLSSFASGAPRPQSKGILAIASEQRDNNSGSDPYAP